MQKRAREKGFILALDEGTSSAKAYIIDHNGFIISSAGYEFTHYFPRPGWVEHDAEEIWHAQQHAALTAIKTAGITINQIVAIGVTNQRETTVLWDKKTGKPVYHAIVWQDRRTSEMVKNLSVDCKLEIKEKTGLIPDSYFSALKIKWIFDNIPKLKEKAKNGTVLFGTIDTFLIYKLTQGALHMTDHSNASRTMLFNPHTLLWDEELLELFGIPDCVLPELKSSSALYGVTDKKHFLCEIPISGCIGDQQAALFGHTAFTPGITKNTYGTGNFVLMNTGDKFIRSKSLLSTVAWSIGTKITYALEGSVFGTGAGVQWVKDQLRYTDDFQKMESLAATLTSNEGVYFVPAFVGLGAPHWDPYARGTIVGMTLGTNNAHLVRAALEAPVYLSQDIIDVIEKDSGIKIKELRVDGGASINNFMMQFQADISNRRVIRPHQLSTTALGAAFVAGLAVGFWKNLNELSKRWKEGTVFEPIMNKHTRTLLMKGWKKALQRAQYWTRD